VDTLSAEIHAVRRLMLTDFRCYEALQLNMDSRPVVLTGPNGAGKTNLLEAVSFLVPGRGLRGARLTDISRRSPGQGISDDQQLRPWAVAARIESGGNLYNVGTGLSPDTADLQVPRPRRAVRIDGEAARGQAALGEIVAALWLTPDMQRLFVDGASGRRRFLDRLVFSFDPAHAGRLQGYEKAMRDRSRVLGDAAAASRRPDSAWLDAVEATMVEKGVAIAAARGDLVRRLNPACAMGVGPFPAAGLAVSGEIDDWLAHMSALDAEDHFSEALVRSRDRESHTRRVTVGPHVSDFDVTHLDRNVAAAQCSTGEQKALLISIVLANARLQALDAGAVPLLLLDEVAAHLDEQRRDALFDEIIAMGAQAWMTGTDPALFAPLGSAAQHFAVAGAQVTPSS
jgi:DNA replication and repair protein RecF